MKKQLREYWDLASRESAAGRGTALGVLMRMVYVRLIYGFGPRDYRIYRFSLKSITAPSSYLKKGDLASVQRRVNKEQFRYLVSSKIRFYERCGERGLPTPEVSAFVRGESEETGHQGITEILTASDLDAWVAGQSEGDYVLKPTKGTNGKGIRRLKLEGRTLFDEGSQPVNTDALMLELNQEVGHIIQRVLEPHNDLLGIMPNNSLGTLRLVTLRTKAGVQVRFGCAKLPARGNTVDNFKAGMAGNLLAGLDLQRGKLLSVFSPQSGHPPVIGEVECHPETGYMISGLFMPGWTDVLALMNRAADAFQELPTLGWDVALTNRGPMLLEANWQYDCDILQIAADRGLKHDMLGWLDSIECSPISS